ncbi:MAG: hypothetical protein ACQRW7_07035 [Caulobacterales bacterium]|uniref:hypothetical protein n=1 Tax=Glycocaulis sp. TaxID=1969725 RepID=UPI003F9ED5ED
MTTDRKTAANADLAYLREMAEAGARAPLLGGRFMAWWGGLTGTVAFTHWLIITGALDLGPQALWPLWLGYMVLGSAGSAVLGWSLRNKPGSGSMANRVQRTVWPVIGGMIGLYFAGLVVGMATGMVPGSLINTMMPIAFMAYGAGWMIDALLSRERLLLVPALVSLLACFACTVFVMTSWVYLIASAGMLLGTFIPGFFLMAREPREVI